ncbi:MAG: type I glyceraldehyde-3-phosphate dehydrogenase [Bacteroidota bacterium]
MSKLRVAINGFGRIGRLSLRTLLANDQVEVRAINDLGSPATLAHLFKYDSNYGCFPDTVDSTETHMVIADHRLPMYALADPENLPWGALQIDTVIETTGKFTDEAGASKHLRAGAKRVVIAAPAQGDIPTIVWGINEHSLCRDAPIVSNGSCTTQCLAPMAQVLDAHFGIQAAYINTIHAYTADQKLHDAVHKDLRRARAATRSIIPTSTGAARALGQVLPQLQGKIQGMALRVPVATGSITDLTVLTQRLATSGAINEAMHQAASGKLQGVLDYTEDPIVSVDVLGNPHACIFDANLTQVQGNLVKVMGWYDNEAGYAQRLVDLVVRLGVVR